MIYGGCYFEQETGIRDGSILSVTHFCLKINSIVESLYSDVGCSLYVVCFSSVTAVNISIL